MFRAREDIIGFFEKGIFPFIGNVFTTKEEKSEEKSEEKPEEKPEEKIEKFINNAIALIEKESKGINNDLFKTYFNFLAPNDLTKKIIQNKRQKEKQ